VKNQDLRPNCKKKKEKRKKKKEKEKKVDQIFLSSISAAFVMGQTKMVLTQAEKTAFTFYSISK
jgi:hypothetical protein